MALSLDVGVLDTLIVGTHVLEFDVELRAQVGAGAVSFDDLDGLPALARIETDATSALYGRTDLGAGVDSAANIDIVLSYNPGVLTTVVLFSGTGAATGDPGYLAHKVRCKKTIGPLRLGVSYGGSNVLAWSWWTDAATTILWEVDGIDVLTETFSDPPVNVSAGLILGWGFNEFNAATYASVRFSGWLFNALPIVHADVEMGATARKYIGPTWQWTMDLAAIGPDGAAVTGAASGDATYNGNRTFPSTFTQTVYQFAEDAVNLPFVQQIGNAVLADQWRNIQTPVPPDNETFFIMEGQTPKVPDTASAAAFNCGTLQILDPVDVLLSTNAFVASGSLVVSGATNTPTFTVSATGASATKTLREHWRSWNGGALNVPGENYTATKRSAYTVDANVPDVWGWSLYAYLDIQFTAAVTASLICTVLWVGIDENDAIRQVPRTYPIACTGAGIYRIDLLFPLEGDTPFYGERVDAVAFSGFAVGVYTLGTVRLRTSEDAYLRYGSRTLGDWGGVVLAQDGQWPTAHWDGDTPSVGVDADLDAQDDRTKDHQNGLMEWAASEADSVAISSFGGAAGIDAETISEVFTELNRLEGLTATYSDAALLAALTDTFGNTITARPAAWLRPNLPHTRLPANTAVNLQARIVASDIEIPGGILAADLIIFQRQRLGVVLDAQTITAAGARGTAAQTITARYNFSGAISGGDPSLGSALTDASGFVTLPVRNGRVGGNDIWLYLG